MTRLCFRNRLKAEPKSWSDFGYVVWLIALALQLTACPNSDNRGNATDPNLLSGSEQALQEGQNSGRGSSQSTIKNCGIEGFTQVHETLLVDRCVKCHGGSQDALPKFATGDIKSSFLEASSRASKIVANLIDKSHCAQCTVPPNSKDYTQAKEWSVYPDACPRTPASDGTASDDEGLPQVPSDSIGPGISKTTPLILSKKLRRVALLFCDSHPSLADTKSILDAKELSASIKAYRSAVENYITEACLDQPLFRFYQHLLEYGTPTTYRGNLLAPAKLAADIVVRNQDYRNLLTAKRCFRLERPEGSDVWIEKTGHECINIHFSNQSGYQQNPAGILTEAAVLSRNEGQYGFRAVNFTLSKILGITRDQLASLPDPSRLSSEQLARTPGVSATIQPTDFHPATPTDPNCVKCHSVMNNIAKPFLWFSQAGGNGLRLFDRPRTTAPNGQEVDLRGLTSTGLSQTHPEDVGFYLGRRVLTLEDLGKAMVEIGPYFKQAAAHHYINYILLRDFNKSLPEDLVEKYSKSLESNGYRVIDGLIRPFIKSTEYMEHGYE